jgi:hypothetical protein
VTFDVITLTLDYHYFHVLHDPIIGTRHNARVREHEVIISYLELALVPRNLFQIHRVVS